MDFQNHLLSTRRVSVWGAGYLGYTTLLWLQSKGIATDLFVFEPEVAKAFQKGSYPLQIQKETWSSKGDTPSLDLSKLNVTCTPSNLFENRVHIISTPGKSEMGTGNRLTDLASYFIEHKKTADGSLILFQSAEAPGDIERYFIAPLKKANLHCFFATAFRTDWSLEEFLFSGRHRIIAANDTDSLERAKYFLTVLDVEYTALSSIKEAEICENARKTLQYTLSTFVNQLALAYPDTDIRKMSELLPRSIKCDECKPSIGAIGYKYASATGHLIDGTLFPERLALVRESGTANMSAILHYVEMIKRRSFPCITILGISEKGDQKDIRLSPALILAEGLIDEGIKVWIHDPYYETKDIMALFPNAAGSIDLDDRIPECDCFVLMTAHRAYRYMTQNDLDRLGITSAKLVIDNAGLWKNISFSEESIYHVPGDGRLKVLEG